MVGLAVQGKLLNLMGLQVFYGLNGFVVHFLHKESICEVSVPGAVTYIRSWQQSGLQESL